MRERQAEIEADTFAGGGGASLGIARALGREPAIAVNHDPEAIAMHRANHPGTQHYLEDVWKADPRKATRGRPVGLLWASPDCKHFSRAKGKKPVEKGIRSLAWIVIKWAHEVRPRVIVLENVREFEDWGPLQPRWDCASCSWKGTEGQTTLARHGRACPACDSRKLRVTAFLLPDPARKGLTFRRFVGRLRGLGYEVSWKVLDAADYGAPTHRRRLFLIARCDGCPVAWPEPTHGAPEKIGRGLFDRQLAPWRTAAECIDWSLPCPSIFTRKRPLAEKTLRRIALGVKRYVLDNPRPFLVVCNHAGEGFRGQDLDSPLPTVTASRDAHGVVAPLLVRLGQSGGNGKYCNGTDEPLTTIVSKAEHMLIAPCLIQSGYGERPGQAPRVLDLAAPMGTAVGGCKQALVTAFLSAYHHSKGDEARCRPASDPVNTIDTQNRHALVAANLVHMNHGEKQCSGCDDPMRTATTGNHAALVYSFLTKYYGTAIGQPVDVPLHTATDRARFGLITVTIDGETYVVADIGMRMLTPRELARGQGFPDSYQLTGTKTSQVARIGNSVPPVMAEVIVRANYAPSCREAVCS